MAKWLSFLPVVLYDIVVRTYFLGIKISSLWDEKARKWVDGRVGVFDNIYHQIAQQRVENQKLVWMHCASLGEFEQGRPLLEILRKEHPKVSILLTFFSPSGYEIRKHYPVADWVAYLPTDTRKNAAKFLALVRPDIAIFVKYEFWFHYLRQLHYTNTPTLLISSVFRQEQLFFKWYGGLHRRMLHCFQHIFVQDAGSLQFLKQIGFSNVSVAGDTRVDRVVEIAENPVELPMVEAFCQGSKVLVCGSTWPADEAILFQVFSDGKFQEWKFILAPHDVQLAHLQDIISKMPVPFDRYSHLNEVAASNRVLLVDTIGILSSLYQFGYAAYIGGGFGQGIHNTLEPAAFGLPIVFGPKYQKFEEAKWMVANGAAFAIQTKEALIEVLNELNSQSQKAKSGNTAARFIETNKGGTAMAFSKVEEFLPKGYD